MCCALVLTGGDPVAAGLGADLPPADLVVAADSGLHLAAGLGLHVDRIVGDLDSVDPDLVEAAIAAGAVVERHPAEKDATDLELAIDTAARAARGGSSSWAVGAGASTTCSPTCSCSRRPRGPTSRSRPGSTRACASCTAGAGRARSRAPRAASSRSCRSGAPRGVVTDGLQYPLVREDLAPGTSRGVSNVLLGAAASIALDTGTLLVVQPDAGRGEVT